MTVCSRHQELARGLRDAGRLMVGVPSYDTYSRHMTERHPDVIPMSEAEYVRDRQNARFGAGGGCRCC